MRYGKLHELVLFVPWAVGMCLAGMLVSPDLFFCRDLLDDVIPAEYREHRETVGIAVLFGVYAVFLVALGIAEVFFGDDQRGQSK